VRYLIRTRSMAGRVALRRLGAAWARAWEGGVAPFTLGGGGGPAAPGPAAPHLQARRWATVQANELRVGAKVAGAYTRPLLSST